MARHRFGREETSPRSTGRVGAVADAIRSHATLTRWLLAGPGALAAAVATMMAMPVWLPAGAAGVDNIAYPLILAPLLWAAPFFYACLEENLVRGVAVIVGVTAAQAGLAAAAMAT